MKRTLEEERKEVNDLMKILHMAAYMLLWIGGLNWGLVGLLNVNFVTLLLGGMPSLERLVYILVGLSTVFIVVTHKKDCMVCSGK